jgi:exopolysaccharide biosynthesis protein
VSSNASGPFVDIPPDDDNIGNILEHSANTAVGLLANGTALLVTVDGYDGCSGLDATCGTNAYTLAYLMKDYFGVASALGMDQGGSTTMFVRGAGVVSNIGQGVRAVFSALFVEEV